MSIRIQADTKTTGVSHRFYPDQRPWGTINFGFNGYANNLYFDDTADIDAVIAELAALRAEMTGDVEYRLTAKGEAALSEGGVLFPAGCDPDAGPAQDEMPPKVAEAYQPARCPCGHAQAHHAFSDDVCAVPECPCDGYRAAQDETPAAVLPHCGALWPNRGRAGGQWTCTLDRGHDGDHEAGTPADGRPFYSRVPQDDDEVTWDETPASVTA